MVFLANFQKDVGVQDCKQFDKNNFNIKISIKEIISNVKPKASITTAASCSI